jgi:hypothetical protein
VAKSSKKRVVNSNGVKRVSKDRVAVSVSNHKVISKIAYESK